MTPESVASWVLTFVAHSTVLGAFAIALAPRVASPGMRCWMWRAALFAPLVTATLGFSAAERTSFGRKVSVTAPIRPHLPEPWRVVRVDVDERVGGAGAVVRVVSVRDPVARAFAIVICAFAAAATGAGVVGWVGRRRRAVRALAPRSRVPVDRDPFRAAGVVFSAAPHIAAPVALSAREICIPSDAYEQLPREHLDAVLLHELAHVIRHDPTWLDAARLMVCATWWVPFNRRLLRSVLRDTEQAADDHAVAHGARPAALVAALASFAARLEQPGDAGTATLPGVAFAVRESELVGRARRILSPRRPRRRRADVTVVCAALLALVAVTFLPVPTPAASSRAERPSVTRPVQVIEKEIRRTG